MNKVMLIGRLCADPELQYVGSKQAAKCSMRLAANRRFTNAQGVREADFFTVIVWQKAAENAARYLKKGSQAAVVGSLQTRSYDKDGEKRYITEVIADEVEFLNAAGERASAPAEGFTQVDDDELPF